MKLVRIVREPLFLLLSVTVIWMLGALYLSRDMWFGLDDLQFLFELRVSFHDVMLPHAEHWVAIPFLLYKALFGMFGLHSYLPYVALTVTAHAATAVLLYFVAREFGVGRWKAVVPAFLFLGVASGRGAMVVLWAFEIQFSLAALIAVTALLAYLRRHRWVATALLVLGLAAGGGPQFCSPRGWRLWSISGTGSVEGC